jgi:hypoxanthine phosphoribosyltransferase
MNYRNLQDISKLIRANLKVIPREIDAVIGIPRSGMIAASMIATLMNKPLSEASTFFAGRMWAQRGNSHTVKSDGLFLIVDDSISGGQTMKYIESSLRGVHRQARFLTLAVYRKEQSPMMTNYTFETVPGPRVFEWNWHRHHYLKSAQLDMDGVICHDPTKEDQVDEKSFRIFASSAKPLFLPKYPVKAIATGRHEYLRGETELWLEEHGVRYGKLFMSTPERGATHTKIAAFCEVHPAWLVESNGSQAKRLRLHTGKSVLCTDNNVML